MRILFISEQFPYPLHDGGNLRTYHILRGLAREHEVTLLTHRGDSDEGLTALSNICRTALVPKTPKLARLGGNLVRMGVGKPLFLLRNRSQQLLACADRLLNSEVFDAIHLNHLDTACFALERRWPQALVFDSHNCLSDLAGKAQKSCRGLVRRAVLNRERHLLGAVETATCARMNVTLVCSDAERNSFQRLWPGGRYELIPNGVDTGYFSPGRREEEQAGVMVFTGAMSYWPNEQAALYFCREILPILKRAGREVTVYFVGKGPSPRLRALHDGSSIIVTGAVDDVRPYIRQSQVVVVPLQSGAGTRLKILEAFAMNKAVVSTSVGAEGIPAECEDQILLADDSVSFARQIARVLEQPELRGRLGDAARKLALEVFDWQSIQQRLSGVYGLLASNGRLKCA
jgi:sugar transferase (PEP-CTERM/EpsH1 system associated)